MSLRLFQEDVLFLQRLLKSSGFYAGKLDGIWGIRTDGAMTAFERASKNLARRYGEYDLRTESSIMTLHVQAQEAARLFMRKLRKAGVKARIISGTRTYKEQNALFRRGRYGNPGPRVTNARGGASRHNFAIAWDIGIFEKGQYVTSAPAYEEAAAIGLSDGLAWGGAWTAFKDRPHYELKTEHPLREIRRRFEKGEAYL
jgi:peptidoglycan L-alanyl-D-glutamate endopeptidase CwlK